MTRNDAHETAQTEKRFNRRDYVKAAGATLATFGLAGCEDAEVGFGAPETDTETSTPQSFDNGEAAVVFFYMGDSRFTTTFQELTRLNQALKGYDRKILLKHSLDPQSISSTAAHNNADRVRQPTRNNFESEIAQLANNGYTIDLYIYSHGWRNGSDGAFRMSTGSHGTSDLYSGSDVRSLQSTVPTRTVPLRMVYQINCWGSNLNSAWRDVGAKAAAGSRYVNFFPHQFGAFVTNWRSGHTLNQSLQNANTPASRTIVHAALATTDAPATRGSQWGNNSPGNGCPLGQTILGNNACAKDYYINRWGHNSSEWKNFPNRKNGQWNMNRASHKMVDGQANITNSNYY